MTSLINASTSTGVVVTPDTSGSLGLQANGTTIATISSTGLTMNSGNIILASTAAPAFRATCGTPQTINNNTATTVAFTSTDFDTGSCFNTSTYRFTPTVAGYYYLTFEMLTSGSWGTAESVGWIRKNSGTDYTVIDIVVTQFYTMVGSVLLYANGSTDYFTCISYQNSGTSKTLSSGCSFQGFLARPA